MQRRTLILGALAVFPAAALAHDGHAAMDVAIDIASAEIRDSRVLLDATLSNFGAEAVTVTGMAVRNARVADGALPLLLPAAAQTRLAAALDFEGPVPGIFSLELAFGDEGSGPVVVMPTLKGESDV